MLWSYAYGEEVLVASFKEQVQGSLGNAEPWRSPWGNYVWWREGISHVFGAEGKPQNLAALAVLDRAHLSLLPEKNGFLRVWEFVVAAGCCANPVFCQKNV